MNSYKKMKNSKHGLLFDGAEHSDSEDEHNV